MLYTGSDQAPRMGDPPRGATEERRTFARRIDCDSSPRTRPGYAPARSGSIRESGARERPRGAYGR